MEASIAAIDDYEDGLPAPKVVPTKVYLNNKGGVGKTTNTSLDAEYNATIKGQRVLLIDWDGHPTYIGPEDPDDLISPRVDIIAGSREGMYRLQHNIETGEVSHGVTEEHVKGYSTRRLISRLAEFCANPELGRYYDQIIIDAGPSETPLFRAAIHAATHIITPYKPEEYSMMGVTTLVQNILSANSNRIGRKDKAKFVGLLPCMVDRGRGGFHEEYINAAVRDFEKYHFPEGVMLINSKKISSRQSKVEQLPDSVFKLKPSDPVRQDCERVFEYIYKEVFDHGQR